MKESIAKCGVLSGAPAKVELKIMQKPSVGRAVHYTSLGDQDGKYPPQCVSATITAIYRKRDVEGLVVVESIHEGVPLPTDHAENILVDLHALYPTGGFDMHHVPFAEWPMQRGCWNWPPRV